MDDRIPETQPAGALVPPPRVPPTAIATSAPLPPRPLPRAAAPGMTGTTIGARVAGIVRSALDELDQLGDRIAAAAGLR